jgi:hypothetical protein
MLEKKKKEIDKNMKPHHKILMEIAKRDLDPKIRYVPGKNGMRPDPTKYKKAVEEVNPQITDAVTQVLSTAAVEVVSSIEDTKSPEAVQVHEEVAVEPEVAAAVVEESSSVNIHEVKTDEVLEEEAPQAVENEVVTQEVTSEETTVSEAVEEKDTKVKKSKKTKK